MQLSQNEIKDKLGLLIHLIYFDTKNNLAITKKQPDV